jgi:hypothetical protein
MKIGLIVTRSEPRLIWTALVIANWFPASATALAEGANHAYSGRVLCKPMQHSHGEVT